MQYAGYQAHYELSALQPPSNKLEIIQLLPENVVAEGVAEELLSLRALTLAQTHGEPPERYLPEDVDAWRSHMAKANYLVALDPSKKEFIGEIETSHNRDQQGSATLVSRFGVNPEYWGKGVGTRLLHAALRQDAFPNEAKVSLFTATNDEVNEWYEQLGFTRQGERLLSKKELATYHAASVGGLLQVLEARIFK